MPTDKSRILLVETAKGFGFGILMTILNWIVFYTLPDGDVAHALQTVLLYASKPAFLLTDFITQDGNIIVYFVLSILMGILQWTTLGFIIGYWQYRKTDK